MCSSLGGEDLTANKDLAPAFPPSCRFHFLASVLTRGREAWRATKKDLGPMSVEGLDSAWLAVVVVVRCSSAEGERIVQRHLPLRAMQSWKDALLNCQDSTYPTRWLLLGALTLCDPPDLWRGRCVLVSASMALRRAVQHTDVLEKLDTGKARRRAFAFSLSASNRQFMTTEASGGHVV